MNTKNVCMCESMEARWLKTSPLSFYFTFFCVSKHKHNTLYLSFIDCMHTHTHVHTQNVILSSSHQTTCLNIYIRCTYNKFTVQRYGVWILTSDKQTTKPLDAQFIRMNVVTNGQNVYTQITRYIGSHTLQIHIHTNCFTSK